MRGRLFICVFLFVPFLFSSESRPDTIQMDKQTFVVPKVYGNGVQMDGVLDEDFWGEAVVIPANVEVRPGENIPAPVTTEARLAYDENYIYVGVKAYDPEPHQIRARYCDRDKIWDDDWILILFDTFNDQRRMYDFVCNPYGIQADLIESNTGGNGSWDAIWESNGQITDEGYVVEMMIPFSALGFPRTQGDQVWSFDVVRSYPRNVRHHIGSFPRDRDNNCYLCQAHKLVGFAGATPGKNIEFDPTVSTIVSQEREDMDNYSGRFVQKENKFHPGMTVKWGMTPNLTWNLTANPDYSNIEADVLQLDINRRFPLYYQEKRPFFLEGADFFRTPLNLVHTRTLADPNAGVKLTGKEGDHTLGFFTVQDDVTPMIFPGTESSDSETYDQKSFGSIFRYRYDLGEKSNLGCLLSDREGDGYFNHVAAFDGQLKFTKKDQMIWQIAGSRTRYSNHMLSGGDIDQPASEIQGHAFQGFANHNTKHYKLYAFHRHADPHFRTDLGFMSQIGYRYTEVGATYKIRRDPGSWFHWLSFYASHDYKRDWWGNPLHRIVSGRVNYSGPMQSHFGFYGEIGHDWFEKEKYRANYISPWFNFRPTGCLLLYIDGRYGDGIDYNNNRSGTRFNVEPGFRWRVGLHFTVEPEYKYEKFMIDAGTLYEAHIHRLKLIYQFDKRLFLRAIIQSKYYSRNVGLYADEDETPEEQKLFSQILLSYKINPQTVFFFGYSDNYYGDQQIRLTQKNRTIFAKLGYAYRL